jgi:hypothetical protein
MKTPELFLDQKVADHAARCVHSLCDTLPLVLASKGQVRDSKKFVPTYFCRNPKFVGPDGCWICCMTVRDAQTGESFTCDEFRADHSELSCQMRAQAPTYFDEIDEFPRPAGRIRRLLEWLGGMLFVKRT